MTEAGIVAMPASVIMIARVHSSASLRASA